MNLKKITKNTNYSRTYQFACNSSADAFFFIHNSMAASAILLSDSRSKTIYFTFVALHFQQIHTKIHCYNNSVHFHEHTDARQKNVEPRHRHRTDWLSANARSPAGLPRLPPTLLNLSACACADRLAGGFNSAPTTGYLLQSPEAHRWIINNQWQRYSGNFWKWTNRQTLDKNDE